MTDGRGFYSIDFDTNPYAAGGVAYVTAESPGHDPSYNYPIPAAVGQDASLNIHLYRITRIVAGESTVLTVVPGDTSCGNDDQFVCRSVHVMAPASGQVLLEAVPLDQTRAPVLKLPGEAWGARAACLLPRFR